MREKNIYDILVTYERYSSLEKIAHLQFHLLEIGTLTKDSLSPEYFDCLPALTEIETETEQNEPTLIISTCSFLDETVCSVPELEELPIVPNPDLTEVPSFLGQNYESRDCTRVLRSHKKTVSSFHPFSL